MENDTQAKITLLYPDRLPRYARSSDVITTPLVDAALGSQGFVSGYTEFAGGAALPFHSHNCAESVVVIEGAAIVDMLDEAHPLRAQDATFIPANVPHRFRNASATAPMKILWIYGRTDVTRTMTETGETQFITGEHRTPASSKG